jgi:hypothetical protein
MFGPGKNLSPPKKKLKKTKKSIDSDEDVFYILQNVKYNFNFPNDKTAWVSGILMVPFVEI